MKKLFRFFPIIVLCLSQICMAYQEEEEPFVPPLDQLVSLPASPEAAAFAKYGNTPVTQYTGTPNISIPLANVAGRTASLPIQLTYDASGIKVEQLASNVGLGWNLNLGGAITRQVNGLPDDYLSADPVYHPYYSTDYPDWGGVPTSIHQMNYYIDYYKNNDMTNNAHDGHMLDAYRPFLKNYQDSQVDTQFDTYSFSAMGISGTIYIDHVAETATCLDHPEYKVIPTFGMSNPSNHGSKSVLTWKIYDSHGNEYSFGKPETTWVEDYITEGKRREYYSAWYLTEFKSTNGKDTFKFIYGAETEYTNPQLLAGTASVRSIGTETEDCPAPASPPLGEYAPEIIIKQFDLVRIEINNVKRVTFVTQSRNDLVGKSYIDDIIIWDLAGTGYLNVIDFQNDGYFETTPGTNNELELRLKLDGIKILGHSGSNNTDPKQIKEYQFSYFEDGFIPSRSSKAQDYWGYYNNQTGNTQLIPDAIGYEYSGGGNRNISFGHSLTGTLQKITYPTGGTTVFSYRVNRVDGNIAGGFRIYRIDDRPDATSTAQTRYFYYDALKVDDLDNLDDNFFATSTASSGILQVPANFVLPAPSETFSGTWKTCAYVTLLASNRSKSKSGIVTYSTVTEVVASGNKTNGFTIYEFNNLNDASTSVSTTAAPLNGRLKSTKIYDENFRLIQEKTTDFEYKSYVGRTGFTFKGEIYRDYDGYKTESNPNTYFLEYKKMDTNSWGETGQASRCVSCLLPGPTNKYAPETFYIQPRWIRQVSETATTYEKSGKVTSTTKFGYDPNDAHYEVASTETRDSENQIIHSSMLYPTDFAGTAEYDAMIADNRTAQVVETIKKKGGADGLVLQHQKTDFLGGKPSVMNFGSYGGALEPRIKYSYDGDQNPTYLSKDDFQGIHYLWDHNASLPTMKLTSNVENAGGGSQIQIAYAYTSFEGDKNGGWLITGNSYIPTNTTVPSGQYVYELDNGNLSAQPLVDTKEYYLEFWARGTGSVKISQNSLDNAEPPNRTLVQDQTVTISSGWKYYRIKIEGTEEVVISENSTSDDIEIDEVRLHIQGDQMTTYAYDVRGNMISQVGPNGSPVHFEYDVHGRLVRVVDHNGNTLKLIEYEYKNTVSNN